MSLTPEDIQGKRFHDAFRGYNHEEVDVFLDGGSKGFYVGGRWVAGSGSFQARVNNSSRCRRVVSSATRGASAIMRSSFSISPRSCVSR